MKKGLFLFLVFILGVYANYIYAQDPNWKEVVNSSDLIWSKTDSSFYNGAFIGDGIQGAMIMRDTENPDGIRMLMGHYKAIAHYSVSGWEYINSRVYAGNIIIAPKGKSISQDMRMDIFNGKVNGAIITDKGEIAWTAFSDRENLVFVVKMETEIEESEAILGVREEWGISPRYYLENKNLDEYKTHLPPKPEFDSDGEIKLVINKMKNKGAHVVASQLVNQPDGSKVIYVAIGADDNNNTTTAASNARIDAVERVKAAIKEGYDQTFVRNQNWWNNYMFSSKLSLNEDYKWQKFWWLQMYKFGCASSETSDFLIDTQGPWITETAWAGVWWNLNVQLSYFPIFSGNKLEAGRSLVNGINRLYDSGALHSNAGGNGISIGRSSTYEGKATWGSEYGNLPWALNCYWKYWKYSGDDEIGKKLFTLLSESATYLKTRLVLKNDGKYHMVESRSPEYSDSELFEDANYGLMSAHWVFKTLLEMDDYFGYNNNQKSTWQEYLDKLTPFPANSNGFMVGAKQGFDKGHRHYSHLLAIYPYHTVNPDNDTEGLVKTSVDRWLSLTEASGHAGYTYTGGCAMLATLEDGNNALRVLDKLYSGKLQPNTMYSEGGGQVIETPLSGVESINYMLLQSWDGIIRIFPAVPDKWKNVAFEDFRTEGAFLVSGKLNDGEFDHFSIFSEKGNKCTVKNPWNGKDLVIKDDNGKYIETQKSGSNYTFSTKAGESYKVEINKAPKLGEATIINNPNKIIIEFTESIQQLDSIYGFLVQINSETEIKVTSVAVGELPNHLIILLSSNISKDDEVSLSYNNGNVVSVNGLDLEPFANHYVENLLNGSAPRLLSAQTDGSKISLLFNKNLQTTPINLSDLTILKNTSIQIEIAAIEWNEANTKEVFLILNEPVYAIDQINLSYSGNSIISTDNGTLKMFSDYLVTNNAPGRPLEIVNASVINNGQAIEIKFDKSINPISVQSNHFKLFINSKIIGLSSISAADSSIFFFLDEAIWFDDIVTMSYEGGAIKAKDNGLLEDFNNLEITNNIAEPDYKTIPGKIEAESYYLMNGIQTESTSDKGGGQNVGYIDNGDWLEYVLLVPESKEYKLTCRVAANTSAAQIDFLISGNKTEKIASLAVPVTGGWQKWTDISTVVKLEEGRQRLRLFFAKGGCNLNWFSFSDDLSSSSNLLYNNNNKIIIFPNPCIDKVSVKSSNVPFHKIHLFDLTGNQLLAQNLQYKTKQTEIFFPNLAAGSYILKIDTDQQPSFQKLIIKN